MMQRCRSLFSSNTSQLAAAGATVLGLFLLFLPAGNALAQELTVSGTVMDGQTGEPLPGANVRVVGTQIGTATNAQGEYELTVPSPDDSLRFTFVGYQTRTVAVQGRTTINVTMQPVTLTGGEVIVTGYTTQRKQDLTGSVEVVNTADMQEIADAQITDQLQGMASGVTVISSGQPGQDPQIRIRGINTFGNNTPLFVVDGVPTQSIGNLDPNDVASIQV
ncbi:MAG: carboxypeptidase-like regulatory domain-containing protein, partial [Salinibacter sp.]